MFVEEDGEVDTSVQQQEADLDTANDEEEETIEDVRAKLEAEAAARAKAEEVAENQRIRAEKAERAKKTEAPKAQTPKAGELTTKDYLVLAKADVPEDDLDEILDYARFKNISVSEALKTDAMKATLSMRAENRKTAEATNVSTAKRTSAKMTDDALLNKAERGELPDSDEDLERLIQARLNSKKS